MKEIYIYLCFRSISVFLLYMFWYVTFQCLNISAETCLGVSGVTLSVMVFIKPFCVSTEPPDAYISSCIVLTNKLHHQFRSVRVKTWKDIVGIGLVLISIYKIWFGELYSICLYTELRTQMHALASVYVCWNKQKCIDFIIWH